MSLTEGLSSQRDVREPRGAPIRCGRGPAEALQEDDQGRHGFVDGADAEARGPREGGAEAQEEAFSKTEEGQASAQEA